MTKHEVSAQTAAFAQSLTKAFGPRALTLAREQQLRATGDARLAWDDIVELLENGGND